MEAKLTREQANDLLHKYVKGEHYITHCYAVEAIMRGLAEKLAPEDVEYWGIVGLLHDLDEETCPWREDMATHGPTSAKILRDEGYGDPVMENAIIEAFATVRDEVSAEGDYEKASFQMHRYLFGRGFMNYEIVPVVYGDLEPGILVSITIDGKLLED